MADIDPEFVKYSAYNTIIVTTLIDSCGDRDEAEQIICDRPELKQNIIDCTKEQSSSISSLSSSLFKMMTKIPGIYYTDEYYVEKFLDKFFPITPEDVNSKKLRINDVLNMLKPQFDRLFLSDDVAALFDEDYYQLMRQISTFSHLFLMIQMNPSVLFDSKEHLPLEYLYSIFMCRSVTDDEVNNVERVYLPEEYSYHLISLLYEIVKRGPVTQKTRELPVATIEKWIGDNEPTESRIKSAAKII